ncbi:hypothetical protein CCR75_001090 [Bremia lactucae]|uniref:Uncharacterized protein n=1 Tax=Bremia lactucae TaxID=4779 RepID=A0A976FSP9_BRELC|nr:hypothetical protein CCR75_001090 [Bremia lactucae]
MCNVLRLQPAGAFLRQNSNVQPLRLQSNPVLIVGNCTDIDEALRLPDNQYAAESLDFACLCEGAPYRQKDESEDFLTSIRRGIDEFGTAATDDDESDDDSDEEGSYYQASKQNTYYSPAQNVSCSFFNDNLLDVSDTSTSSSSLIPWDSQSTDNEQDEVDNLIFQLEL